MQTQWQISPRQEIPDWFVKTIQSYSPNADGRSVAHILWQRGICDRKQLIDFIDPNSYQPTSSFAFGQEMKWAVQRSIRAREKGEKVTIWGDFDADGITATSVLWEGLGQFFPQHEQLNYYVPNRLTESHGLNCAGIDRAFSSGTKLIVTCDTGSTNLQEIDRANQLGIDIIITDHHTLPEERPPVISIINPRYFADHHPLFHLSGVAVAYKLVEAIYQSLPGIAKQPVEELLDLVAIGLVADLVELSGDCRYLAQKGIQKLAERTQKRDRPGVFFLLDYCKRNGDRPTDISFGLGPRINAVSRIHGDATFCVELLTSRDNDRCKELAEATELANSRRKILQKDIVKQVYKKLAQIDLSTTHVIVLEDPQWQCGILGLVAGKIAQEYNRPTVLLSTSDGEGEKDSPLKIARGSARSANNINLYELVQSQAHLLHRFGGHPFAAGLSLPVENLALFAEAIDSKFRQQNAYSSLTSPVIKADLIVTVAEIGNELFRELKLLEPCGMGNPTPRLLIKNCWFKNVWHNNAKDLRGEKIPYLRTTFDLWDDSVDRGFPGMWWEHSKDELPQNQRCDAIVELDFNNFNKCCEIRLIAVRATTPLTESNSHTNRQESLLDCRETEALIDSQSSELRLLQHCPTSWDEIQKEYRIAIAQSEKLALAYSSPPSIDPQQIWQSLIGIAKYLSRTGNSVTIDCLQEKLGLGDRTLQLGLQALVSLGFYHQIRDRFIDFNYHTSEISLDVDAIVSLFLEAVREEQFQRQYFCQISLSTLQDNFT